jgi:hypothetical protein
MFERCTRDNGPDGIKSIKVSKEDDVGDTAEVTIEVTRGSGFVATAHCKLIEEKGEWKVDAVYAESGLLGRPPNNRECCFKRAKSQLVVYLKG